VKLTIIIGLMQFRMHGAYITSVTDIDTPLYYTQECKEHTQMINYSTFNINKTQLLHSTMQN